MGPSSKHRPDRPFLRRLPGDQPRPRPWPCYLSAPPQSAQEVEPAGRARGPPCKLQGYVGLAQVGTATSTPQAPVRTGRLDPEAAAVRTHIAGGGCRHSPAPAPSTGAVGTGGWRSTDRNRQRSGCRAHSQPAPSALTGLKSQPGQAWSQPCTESPFVWGWEKQSCDGTRCPCPREVLWSQGKDEERFFRS